MLFLLPWQLILSQIKGINERDNTIADQSIELSDTYLELEKEKDAYKKAYEDLNNSLRPEDYWKYIEQQNNHESYISYLTNNWTIQKPDNLIDKAIKNINSLTDKKHLKGFIHAGVTSSGVYKPQKENGKHLFKIVWRKNSEEFKEYSKPKPGDVVQLLASRNRRTYKTKKTTGLLKKANTEGWRPGTKAFVIKVEQDGAETKLELRYY